LRRDSTNDYIADRFDAVAGHNLVCCPAQALASLRAKSTAFVPEKAAGISIPAGLAAVAGRLGVQTSDANYTSAFWVYLLQTDAVVDRVIDATYPSSHDQFVSLPEVWSTRKANDTLLSRFRSRKKARKELDVRADDRTGTIAVGFSAADPVLAAAVLDTLLDAVNDFNLDKRQSRARLERQFAAARRDEARDTLASAEIALRDFHLSNRNYANDPNLVFQEGRLRRRVDLAQEQYLILASQYEEARMAEVRDLPVITVVDNPKPPIKPSGPRRKILLVTAVLFATAVTGLVEVVRLGLTRDGQMGDTLRSLASALKDVGKDMSGLLKRSKRTALTHG
jgi:uncharacterized protein involved in exopolysaccharide biosynthesis